jgi:hypothetical protein
MIESEAIKRAKGIVEKERLYWSEPVHAYQDGDIWIIQTNYLGKGHHINITLDNKTGDLISVKEFHGR